MKIKYKDNKYLVFNDNPLKGKIVDTDAVDSELALVNTEIKELKTVLKDDKKLLKWAKEEYPFVSGLNDFKDRKILLENELKEIL